MIKNIRNSKFSKVVACYLVLMIFLEFAQPMVMFALTEGPTQPEFNAFTPIGTSDMVDLSSGDFNYNIPIMDVGGYPINLAYNSGVTMDQEATWTGLGWNLNIGQINRNVRGLPDDFKGDDVVTKNNMKTNVTLNVSPYFNWQLIGFEDDAGNMLDLGSFGAGLNVQYNNYRGISAAPSFGVSFNLSENASVGTHITSTNEGGVTITPSISIHSKKSNSDAIANTFEGNFSPSISYNTMQGLQSFNLASSFLFQRGFSGAGSVSYLNNTFTPTSRTAYKNNQFTFSLSGGPEFWGFSGELSVDISATIQNLAANVVHRKSYGYEFTDFGDDKSLLDFNREKESPVVTSNTLILPVTNYTYDLLTIQGQQGSGTFRPLRGQIGKVYDPRVKDLSKSGQISLEIEGGAGAHIGGNIRVTNSTTSTNIWNTIATPYFKESSSSSAIDYEKTYFKMLGETKADDEQLNLYQTKLGGNAPITLKLNNNDAVNNYSNKTVSGTSSNLTLMSPFLSPLKRTHRETRNQGIQKFTRAEVERFGMRSIIKPNVFARPHHTAGYIVTDASGGRQVYGESVYNISKNEVSFATNSQGDCTTGLVNYVDGENSSGNTNGMDHYFNKVITPSYAHTYLLTSILSPDYEDIGISGPSPDDLGTFTKFIYTDENDHAYASHFKWRVPFENHKASFNEGLKTDKRDQKASYLYGEKEIKYLKRIETKTHVAFIDLEARKDGFGVNSENGDGRNLTLPTYKIKSIRLYTRLEAAKAGLLDDIQENDDMSIQPIKTAHFIYDYSLCNLVGNQNNDSSLQLTENELSNQGGKLTLKKVYFTYRGSNMGLYTPYVFNYSESNPPYSVKSYDIWGNYMNNNSCNPNMPSSQEFPYVDQNAPRSVQDAFASSWSLSSVDLPSGGKINVTYETDDYQYVQNKKAMRMFKVDGVTDNPSNYNPNSSDRNKLYGNGSTGSDYVAINIGDETGSESDIIKKYTAGLKTIYFNFFLNMVGSNYDYVTGYFEKDLSKQIQVLTPGGSNSKYLFIPMKKIAREGRSGSSDTENPISVSGWFFGRQNLNYQIYGQPQPTDNVMNNIIDIGKSLISNIGAMKQLFIGVNGRLKNDFSCARVFKQSKSWIRLNEPDGIKYGGGSRVRRVEMLDEWDNMVGASNVLVDAERYHKKYGQQYDYNLEDGTSSGVATYEPNICKENPLIEPFYNKAETLSLPTYQETPFGESFFPTPTVTYSRVVVENITAADDDDVSDPSLEVRKTKSGTVVTEHFTSKDFPTITDFTDLSKSKRLDSNEGEILPQLMSQMLFGAFEVHSNLTMTQGFYIETNDMNGKLKKQSVYNNSHQLVSSVEYKYKTKAGDPSKLDNHVPIIGIDGKIENGIEVNKEIGTQYDVINDLRESNSSSTTREIDPNIDVIPFFFPIILGFGVFGKQNHNQVLKTAVTTKVVNKTGILTEKIVTDLGSSVSTENLAWDATTGQVLLTRTINEYSDHYYTLNYPAYWKYDGMGPATKNLDITGVLRGSNSNGDPYFSYSSLAAVSNVFNLGDELNMYNLDSDGLQHIVKAWVAGFSSDGKILLIDSNGNYVDECGRENRTYTFRIIRSGYRNQQMQSMASITSMVNPIDTNNDGHLEDNLFKYDLNPNVINATAIEYNDLWLPPSENLYPQYSIAEQNNLPTAGGNGVVYPVKLAFNPYVYNYRGDWRAKRSYAFLTGRTSGSNSPRYQGFFRTFSPFYQHNATGWQINATGWTFASEVSQYNPVGVEIENRDALQRFSSAQYGYSNTLPMALVSNSRYSNMGFEGFEEGDLMAYDSNYLSFYKHFCFSSLDDQETAITSSQSHTGQKSVLLQPGKKVFLRNPLFKSDIERTNVDCTIPLNCPEIFINGSDVSHSLQTPCLVETTNSLVLVIENNASNPNITSISGFSMAFGLNPSVPVTPLSNNPQLNIHQLCFYSNWNTSGLYHVFFTITYSNGQTQNVDVSVFYTPNSNPEGNVSNINDIFNITNIDFDPDCLIPQD